MNEMIIAENINKTFDWEVKAVHAVRDVDVEIAKGERVCIHGPSGAGKSTLLHILAGLDRPTSGTVKFCDNDLYGLSDSFITSFRN